MQPFSRPPPHLLPFGQCIVEQTTLPLLNSLIVYCRVSSNFHFSLSIILFLVQKYWSIKKNSRGGWSGFGKALVWIDPNCHENCLDWSKLFSSLSKLHPNRRCSVILPQTSLATVIAATMHNIQPLAGDYNKDMTDTRGWKRFTTFPGDLKFLACSYLKTWLRVHHLTLLIWAKAKKSAPKKEEKKWGWQLSSW